MVGDAQFRRRRDRRRHPPAGAHLDQLHVSGRRCRHTLSVRHRFLPVSVDLTNYAREWQSIAEIPGQPISRCDNRRGVAISISVYLLQHMENRAAFGGIELETRDARRRRTPSSVLVHHGVGAGHLFNPLFEEPALAGSFRLLRYHRAGYAGSGRLSGPLTFQDEAAGFRGLMRNSGIGRTRLVGHSASACIALQIAADVADVVHSLAVLEPALMAVCEPFQKFLGLSSCTAPATP